MPRPLWNGAVTFGLVTLPVTLEAATEGHDVHFRQIHLEDGGRIRYRKVCDVDGEELSEDEIGRAYEVAKDHLIPITDQDLEQMPLPTARAIDIVAFVDAESIRPEQYGAGDYYLRAKGDVATKPYVLLRKALDRTDKVAIAKYALRGRERLGVLRAHGDALLIQGMHWGDEIRSPAELAPPEVDLTEEEIERALTLLESMTVEHLADLGDTLTDHYTEALHEVIEAKAEHREPRQVEGEEAPAGQVVDLMAALEASVAEARERRGEAPAGGGEATVHELPKPKKRAPAKKSAAKKPAVKKTTAKAAAKKAPAKKTARRRKSA
ncbi:Ku protein [Streptomyces sp. NPDC014861]|uniref:non-homologous end joining protein Ku n=1 Tax=Streptomyces sp. NPDC014861 TaxID=3364923 RepID=UPI00370320EF